MKLESEAALQIHASDVAECSRKQSPSRRRTESTAVVLVFDSASGYSNLSFAF